MSDLSLFLDHCRRMVKAEHRPDCEPWLKAQRLNRKPRKRDCPGCVTAGDRILWERLAKETDAYLRRPQ